MRKHCVFLYFAIFQIRLRYYDIRVRQKEPTGTAELLYPHCEGAWRRRMIRVAQSPRFTAADRDRSAKKKARGSRLKADCPTDQSFSRFLPNFAFSKAIRSMSLTVKYVDRMGTARNTAPMTMPSE